MSGAQRPSPLALPSAWNLVAEGYDQTTRAYLEAFSRSGRAMLDVSPDAKVIDVACGPGTTALLLAPDVVRCACVDFSGAMLDELRRNAAAAGAANLDAIEADGQALPFDDASFDIGISMFGLMFFPDRAKGFAELRRVLVPGGQILVSSWAAAEQSPLVQVIASALRPADAPAGPPPPLAGLEDPAVFEAELRQAGFADIDIRPVAHAVKVDDVATFWQDMVRGTAPLAAWKQDAGADEWATVERQALDRLKAMLGERLPTALSATAWIATARKR